MCSGSGGSAWLVTSTCQARCRTGCVKYLVTSLDGEMLQPWISGYLLLMGVYILIKAFRRIAVETEPPT